MPELLTKYPETALQILKDAKAKCGVGEPQKILVDCPKENFCALPTGELCVYGTTNMSHMTQLHFFDLFHDPGVILPSIGLFMMIFLIGFWAGLRKTKPTKEKK